MDDNKIEIIEEMIDMNMLMFKISKMINRNVPLDEACVLAPTQLAAITVLKNNSPMNMTQLSELLSIPRQHLTKVMDALVSKELVDRYTDPNNRRTVLAEISPKGRDFLHDFIHDKKSQLSQFIGLLNEDQKKELIGALNTIKRIVSEVGSDL